MRRNEPISAPVYVYGIVGGKRAPTTEDAPALQPHTSRLRIATAAPGIHVILADADPAQWSEDTIATGLSDMDWVSERAMHHDEMLAHFLGAEALIPMKAFTLFRSEENALTDVRGREKAVRAILRRVAGCVEWGLRFRLDEELAKQRTAALQASAAPATGGAAFLKRKKTIQDAARNARSEAYAAARQTAEAIAEIARETKVVPIPDIGSGSPLLLDVAYLVPRADRARVERAIDDAAEALRSAAVIGDLTGPWAPFHFAAPREDDEGATR
jgi:hypothetical protein